MPPALTAYTNFSGEKVHRQFLCQLAGRLALAVNHRARINMHRHCSATPSNSDDRAVKSTVLIKRGKCHWNASPHDPEMAISLPLPPRERPCPRLPGGANSDCECRSTHQAAHRHVWRERRVPELWEQPPPQPYGPQPCRSASRPTKCTAARSAKNSGQVSHILGKPAHWHGFRRVRINLKPKYTSASAIATYPSKETLRQFLPYWLLPPSSNVLRICSGSEIYRSSGRGCSRSNFVAKPQLPFLHLLTGLVTA